VKSWIRIWIRIRVKSGPASKSKFRSLEAKNRARRAMDALNGEMEMAFSKEAFKRGLQQLEK
jgi:hypothetical protein